MDRLSAETAVKQTTTTTVETKPLNEILNSQILYTTEKLAPAPRFGQQVKWKVSEDFIPPNDGKVKIYKYKLFVFVFLLIYSLKVLTSLWEFILLKNSWTVNLYMEIKEKKHINKMAFYWFY